MLVLPPHLQQAEYVTNLKSHSLQLITLLVNLVRSLSAPWSLYETCEAFRLFSYTKTRYFIQDQHDEKAIAT